MACFSLWSTMDQPVSRPTVLEGHTLTLQGHLTSEVLQPLSYSPLTKLKARQVCGSSDQASKTYADRLSSISLARYRQASRGSFC